MKLMIEDDKGEHHVVVQHLEGIDLNHYGEVEWLRDELNRAVSRVAAGLPLDAREGPDEPDEPDGEPDAQNPFKLGLTINIQRVRAWADERLLAIEKLMGEAARAHKWDACRKMSAEAAILGRIVDVIDGPSCPNYLRS